MGIAQDLIDQANALVAQRAELERTWDFISRLLMPHPDRRWRRGTVSNDRDALEGWAAGSKVSERARLIYDITGIIALERLTTGMISLITPDSEKWQGLQQDDPFGAVMDDAQTEWAEAVRDYLFTVRYDPRSGWALANQAAIRSAAALGTGAYIIEEVEGANGGTAAQIPYRATNLPLSDNYLTVNGQGFHDQNYRFMSLEARVAATLFNGNLSPQAMKMANDPQQWSTRIQILHYVGERKEKGPLSGVQTNMPIASIYVEMATKHEISHGGFGYWPIIVYNWNQMTDSPYGESAAMLVMSEVAAAQVMAKNTILASQQHIKPPVGTTDDGAMNRPNLNPGAINFGALDAQGNPKIKPLTTGADPRLSQVVLDASRQQIKDGLYTSLWQILIQNPNMTATEAMIRANEKGELLGPIGARIQHGLARLTDAELTILSQKDAFNPRSPLAVPQKMQGKKLTTKFASPLERLRRSQELIGIQQTVGIAASLFQADQSVMDNLDSDEIIRVSREITGAPAKILRHRDEVEQIREQRAQQQQLAAAQQVADVAKTGAEAAAAGVPAVQGLSDILAQYGAGQGAPA